MRRLVVAVFVVACSAGSFAQQPRRPATPKSGKGPATSAPAPRRELSVPFAVGETLTFDISWSQFLTAGTAVTRVVDKRASSSSTALYVVADGKPVPLVARFYPLYYKMDTLVDSFTGLSQVSTLYQEESTRKRRTTMRFDRAKQRVYYEIASEPPAKADFAAPSGVQDGLATLYMLRARTFKTGDRFTIPVADDGTLYSVQFENAGAERVVVPAGRFDAWNIRVSIVDADRQTVGKNVGVWISSDA